MYEILVSGITVKCETAEDVLNLIKQFVAGGMRTKPEEAAKDKITDPIERYMILLKSLLEAGEEGINAKDLGANLGYKSGRGLSGVMLGFRRYLKETRFSVDDVRRIDKENGLWRPAGKTRELFSILRSQRRTK